MAFAINALETRDDDHAAGVEISAHALVVDRLDAGLGVGRIGLHGHLPAGVTAGVDAFGMQRDGQQAHAHLLASRGNHVEFTRVRLGRNLFGHTQQAVGFAGHGRRNDHDLVTGTMPLGNALGDILDAFN